MEPSLKSWTCSRIKRTNSRVQNSRKGENKWKGTSMQKFIYGETVLNPFLAGRAAYMAVDQVLPPEGHVLSTIGASKRGHLQGFFFKLGGTMGGHQCLKWCISNLKHILNQTYFHALKNSAWIKLQSYIHAYSSSSSEVQVETYSETHAFIPEKCLEQQTNCTEQLHCSNTGIQYFAEGHIRSIS